jgi:hypothetical protein
VRAKTRENPRIPRAVARIRHDVRCRRDAIDAAEIALPYSVERYQDTPNPNALKCVIRGTITPAPRSFFSADQAKDDPLAAALFAVPGVTNVLIHEMWITVNKSPDASWKTVKAGIERVLHAAP